MSTAIAVNNNACTGPAEGDALKKLMKKGRTELKRLSDNLNKAVDNCGYIGVVDIYGKCWFSEAIEALEAMLNFIVGAHIEPNLNRRGALLPLNSSSEGIKALVEYRRGAKENIIKCMNYWTEDDDTDFHRCLDMEKKNAIKAKALHVIKIIEAIEFKHHISMSTKT